MMFGLSSWRRAYDIDRSKIHAYVQTYESGAFFAQTPLRRYELRPCKASDFHSPFEKGVWKLYQAMKFYCIDDPEETITLWGNENTVMMGGKMIRF